MQAAQEGQLNQDAVPRVHLHATDKRALNTVSYKDLKRYGAEAEAAGGSVRQGSHQSTENSQSIAKESQEIGNAQPTVAPGAGRWQGTGTDGEVSKTSGNRG